LFGGESWKEGGKANPNRMKRKGHKVKNKAGVPTLRKSSQKSQGYARTHKVKPGKREVQRRNTALRTPAFTNGGGGWKKWNNSYLPPPWGKKTEQRQSKSPKAKPRVTKKRREDGGVKNTLCWGKGTTPTPPAHRPNKKIANTLTRS